MGTSVIALRPADPDDLDAIQALEGLSASTRRLLATDLHRAQQPGAAVVALVAEQEGAGPAPAGQAAAGPAPAGEPAGRAAAGVAGVALGLLQVDEGHVVDLAVGEQWRRRGVGRELLRALMAALIDRGARAVTLEVRPSNLGALALYRSEGFAVEGRRPRYYPDGEDALLLWCRDPVAAGRHRQPSPGRAR